ncbi:MAG: hypothetical protein K2X71_28010 [Methylobacterium sp.]|uniref:hypothetical protein n=1 Tax=Methylobacterium sp. TaxID=409 RepID=UPI0025871AF0|nr:hypothetical protein [Methylobacterium sp.]MBY0299838.1 hypothetical protein [Methylobacterium sp.]
MAKQDDYVRITLRIPAELHHRLVEAVADRPHSMNAEIIQCIERGLAHRDMPGGGPGDAAATAARSQHIWDDWSNVSGKSLLMILTSASAEALAKQKDELKAEILRELKAGQTGRDSARE